MNGTRMTQSYHWCGRLHCFVGPRILEESLDNGHVVTSAYGSRGSDHGVHASAGELTEIADLHPIVVNEHPQNIGILGEIFLCKVCTVTHDTSGRDLDL